MVGGDDPANVPESSKEAPHPQKPPADALSTSTYLTPESALASSPILKNDSSSPLPTLNDKLRASRVSSFRFSKDLEDIRWDGSSIREDDSMFPDEDEETHQDGDMSASEDEGNEGRPSKADLGAAAYSTLSKRAEFILANAKKKLNVVPLSSPSRSILADVSRSFSKAIWDVRGTPWSHRPPWQRCGPHLASHPTQRPAHQMRMKADRASRSLRVSTSLPHAKPAPL